MCNFQTCKLVSDWGVGPTMVEGVVGSSSWGLVRCIKFAVYGAVCGQIVLILIRKYRFVFNRKLLQRMLIYRTESFIMIQPA